MKILAVSPIIPHKNNIRIAYVNSVTDFLQTKTDVELFWLVFQPNKIKNNKIDNITILDIHQFPNALKLIKEIKPDIFLANITLDPINYSFSLASAFHKIPIVCFNHSYFSTTPYNSLNNKVSLLFSSKLPSDMEQDAKFMGRVRFYFFKYSFLVKTRLSLGINFQQIISIIKDTSNFLTGGISKLNLFGDQYLLPDKFAFKKYEYENIKNKDCIHFVGNPYWDTLSKKIRQKIKEKQISKNKKILIVTGSLYEHGYWTKTQRDNFLMTLFLVLSKNNFSFALKIHPSSENKLVYKELLKSLNLDIQIFQDENLWDVAYDFDMLISYGYSQAITEIAYSGHKLIFLDAGIQIPEPPLLNDAIKEGNVISCQNIETIPSIVNNFSKTTITLSKDFEKACNSIFPKSDGKSHEKIGKIILDIFS
jgi:hypothetical protein